MATPHLISRAEAKRLELKRYFTGQPCKHGHIAERATVNGLCLECSRLKRRAQYQADPQADLQRQKEYREAHPELQDKKRARRYQADPELARRVELRATDKSARAQARARGFTMYDSPRECGRCGTSRRFAGDAKCVECNRLACSQRVPDPRRVLSPEEKRLRILELVEKRAQRLARIRERKRTALERQPAPNHVARLAAGKAREAALAQGELTYQGRPCPKGHGGLRYAKHGSCVTCAAEQASSEAKKRYDAAYLEANRERIIRRTRAYYENNRERRMKEAKEWKKRNPELAKAIKQNYTHRRRAQVLAGVSSSELAAWKKAQKKVCYWCGCACAKGFVIDHYQPLAKGGKHELENLVLACRPCNARKSAKDPLEFAASRGRLF